MIPYTQRAQPMQANQTKGKQGDVPAVKQNHHYYRGSEKTHAVVTDTSEQKNTQRLSGETAPGEFRGRDLTTVVGSIEIPVGIRRAHLVRAAHNLAHTASNH